MLKRSLPALAMLFAAATAGASDLPPAVEAMDCDQMRVELIATGKKMSSQLDPEFAKEGEAMQAEMEAKMAAGAGAMAKGVGMSVACSVPGIDMFCMTAQYAQNMAQAGEAAQNLERMQAQVERIQRAMEGIDVDRMQALSERFEQQKCEVPQQ